MNRHSYSPILRHRALRHIVKPPLHERIYSALVWFALGAVVAALYLESVHVLVTAK